MRFTACFVIVLAICMTVYGENSPATQALFKACQVNSLPQIQKSIEEGADVNAANEQGVLPLFYAVQNGNTQAVDLFLGKGAKLDTPTKASHGLLENTSAPVLMWAVSFNKKDMVSYLIAKGASVDIKSSNGVHLICLAVRAGNIGLLDTLATKGVKFDGRFVLGNKQAGSLLHLAIETDSVPMLTYLLQKNIDIELRNEGGHSPLMLAAYQGNLEMVKLLVAKGAYLYADRGFGKTLVQEETGILSPLIQNYLRKIDREATEAIQAAPWAAFVNRGPQYLDGRAMDWNQLDGYLKQGGSLAGVDDEKNTLLHYIAANRLKTDLLNQIIASGQDINAVNIHGLTPLHRAVRDDSVENIKILLEHGADVHIRDKEGNTPLQVMANNVHNGAVGAKGKEQKIAITKMLLERGAEINVQNVFGLTPIIKISEHNMDNRTELIKLLIDKGADVNIQSGDFQTALHLAADRGTPTTVKMLLDAGASVTVQDIRGRTPLDTARYDQEEKVALMFPYKKDACIINAVCYGQVSEIEKLARTSEGGVEHIHPAWDNGATALIFAAQEDKLEIVEKLIVLKANVNAQDTQGNTALHFAAGNGNDDIVYALLTAGAKQDCKNKEGKTAYDFAVAEKHPRTVQIFKENISSGHSQAAKQNAGADKIAVESIETDDPNEVRQRVIERRHEFAEQLRPNSNRPLHQAVLLGKVEFVKQLLAQDKSSAGKTDGAGMLPLTYAALTGQKEMVTLLLDNGANINQLDENTAFGNIVGVVQGHVVGSKAGWGTLHYLSVTEDVEMMEFMISKGADVNIKETEFQRSPVWTANDADNIIMMKTLVSRGANLNQFDKNGSTLINSFSQYGRLDIIERLLALGADINTRDKSGRTPLISACIWGKKDAILYLIEKGADLKAVDGGGGGPLHAVVSEEEGAEAIRILIEHGADVNQKAGNGSVPLFAIERAVRYGYKIKEGHINNIRLLVEAGADLKARNNVGDSILHIAADMKNLEIVRIAVEHGADVNCKNNKGQTPLSRTIDQLFVTGEKGPVELVQYLVEKDADAKFCYDKSNRSSTLLHIAAQHGQSDIAKILLDHGADVNAIDVDMRTPLHYAAIAGNADIIRMFLKAGARYDVEDLFGQTPPKLIRSENKEKLLPLFEEKK